MPVLLLLFLLLICSPDYWPAPIWIAETRSASTHAWMAWTVCILTWGIVAGEMGLAYLIARRVHRCLTGNPTSREDILRRYARWRFYHLLSLFASYGFALCVVGWGWAVQHLCGGDLAAGAEFLVLAPFLAALVASWAAFYEAERSLHGVAAGHLKTDAIHLATVAAEHDRPCWSRWEYVGFQVRHNLALVIIPVCLLVFVKAADKLLQGVGLVWEVPGAVGMLIALASFTAIPWVLRVVLGLKPMPAGPLRDRLMATARRLGFRCSNIMIWNTRGGVANAMVAGVLPVLRYVILTDRLVTELKAEEVEAVFGHEVGHVKHLHMISYLTFLLLSLATMGAVAGLLFTLVDGIPALHGSYLAALLHPNTMARPDFLKMLPVAAIVGVYIFVVFGFLSRRCERQADLYGCRTVSCLRPSCSTHELDELPAKASGLCPTGIRTFINALEKVALLNGISRERPGWLHSWQHSTIAQRVAFLKQVIANPDAESAFQRKVFLIKCSLFAALGLLLLILGAAAYTIDNGTRQQVSRSCEMVIED